MPRKIKVPPMPKAIESYDDAGCLKDKVLVFEPPVLGPLWLTGIITGITLFVCGVMR